MNSLKQHPLWVRHRKKVRWGAIVFVAYTVLGFLILPLIVKWVAARQLSKLLDRTVTIQSVRLNPYVFSATIRGFLVTDKDGEPFLSWDEVYVNVQPTSVFAKAWAVKEVRTVNPYVRAQVNPDRKLNFSDLIEKFSKEDGDPAKEPAEPIALEVEMLEIDGARASLADLTTRVPFRRMVGPLNIKLNNFHTKPDNKNPYSFTGTTDAGEKFRWSGHFYLSPIRSEGELSLENLVLSNYAPLFQDLVKFDIEQGIVDFGASYQLVHGTSTNYAAASKTRVNVRAMKVRDRSTGELVAELPEFKMTGAAVDVWKRRGEVGAIEVAGARLNVKRAKDASINLVQLSEPAATSTNVSGGVLLLLQSVTNVFSYLLSTTNQWEATLHELKARDCSVRLEDLVNSRPVNLAVDEIAAEIRHVSNVPGTNLTAKVSLRWNTNGTVRTDVAATLLPMSAEIGLKLDQIELQALDPYLEPFVDVLILRSRLGMDATITARQEGTNPLPVVKFRGDIALEDLGAAEPSSGNDLIRWKGLRFSGVEANLEPATFNARELAVDDLFAHVVLETNGVINLLAAARLVETNSPPAAAASNSPAPKKGGALPITVPTNATPVQLPVAISIGAVVFTNGHLQFTDRTVSPQVDVSVQQLEGAIRGVSSKPEDRAELDVYGKVENTGAVHIQGTLHPMFVAKETAISVSVSGLDLKPTGPYVGRFLGYRLTKGKLGVEVKYDVRDGTVKGANLIKLDQFTLGGKVESPDAMSLPIKLGIAILKDRNGLIELDVPVEGSLNDPEFRLGRVITRAVVNVLTKIVTSPFAALGAVFGGGGEELSYQEFEPGSSELRPTATAKLDKVVNGLFERPGLQLEIEGAVDLAIDGAALRRQKLEAELRLAKWQELSKSARAETSPERIGVTPEEFTRFIEKRYEVEFSPEAVAARGGTNAVTGTNVVVGARRTPATVERPGSPPEQPAKGAVALRGEAVSRAPKVEAHTMESQVIGLVPLSETDYARLAADRARRVRDYILQTGKVEAERLLMSDAAGGTQTSKGSKAFLKLQ